MAWNVAPDISLNLGKGVGGRGVSFSFWKKFMVKNMKDKTETKRTKTKHRSCQSTNNALKWKYWAKRWKVKPERTMVVRSICRKKKKYYLCESWSKSFQKKNNRVFFQGGENCFSGCVVGFSSRKKQNHKKLDIKEKTTTQITHISIFQ